MSTEISAADGQFTSKGRPLGSTSLTPHIVIDRAAQAINFYRDVLGATVLDVTRLPGDELIAHAILDFGSGRLTLSDPLDAYGLVATDPVSGHSYSLALYVEDADTTTDAAEQHGATIREPVMTFASGDRFSSILDPFGVRWSIMTRVEDLSEDESARRIADWAASQKQPTAEAKNA
jgi:PhnB protein